MLRARGTGSLRTVLHRLTRVSISYPSLRLNAPLRRNRAWSPGLSRERPAHAHCRDRTSFCPSQTGETECVCSPLGLRKVLPAPSWSPCTVVCSQYVRDRIYEKNSQGGAAGTNTTPNMSAVGKCFAHLGAGLAPVLFNRLIEMGWIEPQGGKRTVFDVTEKGSKGLKEVFDIHASELDA